LTVLRWEASLTVFVGSLVCCDPHYYFCFTPRRPRLVVRIWYCQNHPSLNLSKGACTKLVHNLLLRGFQASDWPSPHLSLCITSPSSNFFLHTSSGEKMVMHFHPWKGGLYVFWSIFKKVIKLFHPPTWGLWSHFQTWKQKVMSGNQHLDAGYLVHNNHLVCNDCIVWGCYVFFNSLVNSKSIVDYQSGSSVKKPTPITSLCRLQIQASCFYMNLNFWYSIFANARQMLLNKVQCFLVACQLQEDLYLSNSRSQTHEFLWKIKPCQISDNNSFPNSR
jgi:hypothetical protein